MAELPGIIEEAYKALCQLKPSESGIDVVFIDGIRFIGIDIKHKATINQTELRGILMQGFPSHERTKIVQVIGDSGTPVHGKKLSYAQTVLDEYVTDDSVVEYGFTRSEHDANWLVEDLVTRGSVSKSILIGNIVQVTISSIDPPLCSAFSWIENLVFVYRRTDHPTSFGDDIWVSDGVMTAETGDTMICFEGGQQAFSQCVNVLLANIKVIAVTNLRASEDVRRFSAAGLLACLSREGLSEEIADAYLTQYPPKTDSQEKKIRGDVRRLLDSGSGSEASDFPIQILSALDA